MFYKSETKSVAQSHKARHLMSVMLYLKVLSEFSPELGAGLSSRRLAVASCGNAGLAAATIAAAAQWPIDVFVPPICHPNGAIKIKFKFINYYRSVDLQY